MIRWLLNKLLPEDSEPGCGYGPFKWPADHPFTRGCFLHDYDFEQAHIEGKSSKKSLEQANWDMFKRWFWITQAEPDLTERLRLVDDMCRGYPLAKFGGKFLWDGRRE